MISRNNSSNQPGRAGLPYWKGITSILFILSMVLTVVVVLVEPKIRSAFADNAAPTLTVNASSDRYPISQDIYGMNRYALDAGLSKELGNPVDRLGGNNTSRYNWKADSTNSGDNYYYAGGGHGIYMGDSKPETSNGTDTSSADRFVNQAASQGSKTLMTVPMVPYITKTSEPNCSYPKSLYPNQGVFSTVTVGYGDVCGNGRDASGKHILDTNIGLNNAPNSPDFQKAWIQHLVATHGTAANKGVNIYNLDNEPSIWYDTHADIHPDKTGYDELVKLSTSYAQTIKSVDPTAATAGPVDFGWCGYLGNCFGKAGDDFASHKNTYLSEYYLQQMHAYEQTHGTRLLDYFDEHYYPEGTPNGTLYSATAGSSALQKDRLNSTRSLWDPTYVENNWIGQRDGAINLLPRFHNWINKDYPGTKLAISEYNFGGLESMNGALTQADVLGIFGREKVDLATIWGPPTPDQPGAYAFRMYRNYDGKGSKYGDTWIKSSSSDQSQLAVYGAQRSSDQALTLMIINKTGNALTSNLSLTGANPTAKAQVYTYSSANLKAIVRQPDLAVNASKITTTYPANSITLLVVPTNGKISNSGKVLTGSVISDQGGALYRSRNTANKAFDGNTTTFYDAAKTTGAWTGIDLGKGNTAVVNTIKYYPRPGYTYRMVGGSFQGSNDLSNWTTLSTIRSDPGLQWTTVNVTNTTGYRYLRYLSASTGSFGNVADIQFIGNSGGSTSPVNTPSSTHH